jgi:hypothetical protein
MKEYRKGQKSLFSISSANAFSKFFPVSSAWIAEHDCKAAE